MAPQFMANTFTKNITLLGGKARIPGGIKIKDMQNMKIENAMLIRINMLKVKDTRTIISISLTIRDVKLRTIIDDSSFSK